MTTRDGIQIRVATAADAEGISRLVIRTLRETNAQDYAPDIIDTFVSNHEPDRVASLIASRRTYVAIVHGTIIGTAGLQDSRVRTVFVDPDHQGNHIGARLMDAVESFARTISITTLSVASSVTAKGFYNKLGYSPVHEAVHGKARTIIMEKCLNSQRTYVK